MEEDSPSREEGFTEGKAYPDNWDSRACRMFFSGHCQEGKNCSLKHILPIKELVCKFMLQGECTRGSLCPFLHEVIPDKLPECRNYIVEGDCKNPDCKFKHSGERREAKECVYYNMGYCSSGKFCKFKHVRRDVCLQYVEKGSCPLGENCPRFHLDINQYMFEGYLEEAYYKMHPSAQNVGYEAVYDLCVNCRQFGHYPTQCPLPKKNDREVRCYKCMYYGHKANACPNLMNSV